MLWNNSSNIHLQHAIVKHGLSSFVFMVLVLCEPTELVRHEQQFLDWLFKLPSHLRYNFLPTAYSKLGSKPTEESKALMSAAKIGDKNPIFGKVPPSAFRSGPEHPKYGKVGFPPTPNARAVYIYSVNGLLVQKFPTQVAAAEWLGVSRATIQNYIKSGKPYNKKYIISSTYGAAQPTN